MAITDRPGILSYQQLCEKVVSIWIQPPSLEILSDRLINRGTEAGDALQKRLKLANEEMDAEMRTPICQYHIINSDLVVATRELIDIVKSSLADQTSSS